MLKHLYIENFILIDRLDLEFNEGFSAFIGETGAGKSIFIDAIGVLCGDRASATFIRKDCSRAVIEGTFDLSSDLHAVKIMNESGLDIHELTTFTKEIYSTGKSTSRIDHRIVTAGLMRQILENQIDIHGQRDNAYLLNTSYHIHLLDQFLQADTELENVRQAYRSYESLLKERDKALQDTYNENDLEYFNYQIEEIENAHLVIGEEEELNSKEKEYKAIKESYEKLNMISSLYESEVIDNLYELNHRIQALKAEGEIESIQNDMNNAYYELTDAMDRLNEVISGSSMSEEDVNEMEERLFLIQKMKRKYGRNIQEILDKKDELIEQVEMITHRQEYLDMMEKRLKKAFDNYQEKASVLTHIRKSKSALLDNQIAGILKDLKLNNAAFKTSITDDEPSPYGNERVEFLIAMNKGDDFKPLSKTASGGELSRLMLGLKVIFTKLQGIGTVIFDEIDTGVSGAVATAIGKKMKELSCDTQVFSVTHLAQVAACADHHYLVAKDDDETRTNSRVIKLDKDGVIEQLAMISSGEITTASLQAAEELFERNHE